MKRSIILSDRSQEAALIASLAGRTDAAALRVLKFHGMPDLSRTPGNPVNLVCERVKAIPEFSGFDLVETPEAVGLHETFDLFNFAPDHPARRPSDTYFVTEDRILRTHTTVLWYYYLGRPEIRQRLEREGEIGALSHGKVYRKDEIDARHFPVFHQIDGLYLCSKDKKNVGRQDLVDVLVRMAKAVFGEGIEWRVNDDKFPYTDPSVEMEIMFRGKWMEILGAGVVLPAVLKNLGVDPDKYNGWAFGPGIERLAMIAKGIQDIRILWSQDQRITAQWGNLDKPYQDVSKYPSTYRDISFLLPKDVAPNAYFEIVRDCGGDMVEEVAQLDRYENPAKFGDKVSYLYRVVYRSHERTLTNDEVNATQTLIRSDVETQLGATLR